MTMKIKNLKNLLLLFCLLIASMQLMAQKNGGHILREKIRSQKVAYLSSKLELTEDEAVKFWPIYNQYEKDQELIRQNLAQDAVLRNMTEAEADQNLHAFIEYKEKELEIEKKYIAKFKSILSSKKILKVFYYDKEFRKELAEVVKKRVDKRNRN